MKLNGSIAVDFSALDAEFSALQSSSAEFRTQLETLQPDISDLKSVRKYIDMVLNKQQLFAPGGKTPEKESVLKSWSSFSRKSPTTKRLPLPKPRRIALNDLSVTDMLLQSVAEIHNSFCWLLAILVG